MKLAIAVFITLFFAVLAVVFTLDVKRQHQQDGFDKAEAAWYVSHPDPNVYNCVYGPNGSSATCKIVK